MSEELRERFESLLSRTEKFEMLGAFECELEAMASRLASEEVNKTSTWIDTESGTRLRSTEILEFGADLKGSLKFDQLSWHWNSTSTRRRLKMIDESQTLSYRGDLYGLIRDGGKNMWVPIKKA
jgi:hypothetical protein